MKQGCEKYIPFQPINIPDRQWPSKTIEKPPIWCSVDLRDGNQALIDPMNLQEKIEYFKTLVKIGFKEIEVGFPSASETTGCTNILHWLHYMPSAMPLPQFHTLNTPVQKHRQIPEQFSPVHYLHLP